MKEISFAAIIPARYASTRFPGKPLSLIGGQTMIERVYKQASKAIDTVYVATDDKRIFDTVVAFGGKAIMTLDTHQSGTDRLAEAASILAGRGEEYDVVINIQGDEPFIQIAQIDALTSCFADKNTQIATLVEIIKDEETLFNTNSPKVVLDNIGRAIYFSRHPIPYQRGKNQSEWISCQEYYKHIGIYAYKTNVLREISELKPSSLELAESLEQLRWLQNGYTIQCALTRYEGVAVDTPEDLQKANDWLKANPHFDK